MTDESSEPRVIDNPERHRFEAQLDGAVAGFSDYERKEAQLSLLHVEVDDRFESQGIGSLLARRSLETAREDGLSVLPHCPFVRRYIERHPEYLDLVAREDRKRFGLSTG